MSEVHVVEVLSQRRYGIDSNIGDVTTFCQDEVAEPGRCFDNLLNRKICQASTRGKIQDPEVIEFA